MTHEDFRRIALAMPRSIEILLRGRPNYRVGRKTFASLDGPNDSLGIVRLTPDQQAMFLAQSLAFVPVPGGWGRLGSTVVELGAANRSMVEDALAAAWGNVVADGRR
jgi:hypothetical protein